jgi:hypothetical protein
VLAAQQRESVKTGHLSYSSQGLKPDSCLHRGVAGNTPGLFVQVRRLELRTNNFQTPQCSSSFVVPGYIASDHVSGLQAFNTVLEQTTSLLAKAWYVAGVLHPLDAGPTMWEDFFGGRI